MDGKNNAMARARRRIGWGMAVSGVVGVVWALTPGLPILRAPRASAEVRAAGRTLFEHEWEPRDPMAHGDGLGPVFNARACASCHFQGGVGGGGGNDHNVLAFEAHPTRDRPDVEGGLVHRFAVDNGMLEDVRSLHQFFPIVPNGARVVSGCQILAKDFDPIRTQRINSSALFGAGWVDRISGKTILHEYRKRALAQAGRELSRGLPATPAGRPRALADGRLGKFGWKAQFATLEEFVAAACANEIGLGNPRMEQARPRTHSPYPQVEPDLDARQFRALVSFVDTLPRPERVMPTDSARHDQAARGERLFASVGCASCHTPDVGGLEGVYSDFLLHRLDDRRDGFGGYQSVERPEVPLPEDYPLPEEWKTPPLWGVADSSPYFHDGGSATLEAAILRHQGDAREVTEAYRALSPPDAQAVVAFLKTLRAPADATPVVSGSKGTTAMARR